MASARKYDFATEFSADGKILHDGEAAARRLSPEEVAAECAQAYERGKNDALAQAERETAAALNKLAGAAAAILTRLNDESSAMRAEAAAVAAIAARKIAGAALDQFSADYAAAAIEAAMDGLRHQPRLIVRVPENAVDALRPRIEEMREAHAYAGAVVVRADAALKTGAVAIDWGDGVVAHDPAETAQRIEHLVEAALSAASHES